MRSELSLAGAAREEREMLMMRIMRTAIACALLLIVAPFCDIAVGQQRPADIAAMHREIDRLLKADRLPEAAAVAGRLVALTRERAGEQSLEHARALSWLAYVYGEQERYLEALPVSEKVLQIYESILGPDHVGLAHPLNELAAMLGHVGRRNEAIPLLERVVALDEKRLGPTHPGIVSALTNLANAYNHVTTDPLHVEKMERLYLRAIDIQRRSSGAEDDQTSELMLLLAANYKGVGRYEDAERLLQQVLAARRKPGRDGKALAAMELLAELYSGQGRFNQAIEIREALLERLARLEPNGYLHAGILAHLGASYLDQGRYDEAAALNERSLAIMQRLRGPDAIELGVPLHNLGTAHYFSGRPVEAEPLLRRSLAISERSTGSNSSEVAHGLTMLVRVLRHQRRFDEARTLAERKLAIEEKLFGPDTAITGQASDLLASVHHAQGRHLDARAFYRKAAAVIEKSIGREHPIAMATIKDLSGVECALGEFDVSLSHAREAAGYFSRRAERSGARDASAREVHASGAFPALMCAAFGAAGQRPREREALASEALIAAQQDRRTLAEAALAQMAVRASAGNAQLAEAVRRQQDLAGRLRALDQQLIVALSKTDGGKGEADRTRAQRAQTERQLGETIAIIERTNSDFAALTNPQPIDIAQVRRQLNDDEALVVHAVTDTVTYVWAITRTGLIWERIPMGTAALTQQIAAFRRPLDEWAKAPRGLERLSAESQGCAPDGTTDPRGLGRADAACADERRFSLARAHELYAALLAPVEPVVKGKRHLILVPSGPLTGLPFSALLTEKPADASGSSRSFAAAPWLVRRHATTVLPSVASLALLRQQVKASRATRSFVGVGNPDFSGGTPVATGRPGRAGARTAVNAPAIPPVQVAEARGFSGYFRGGRPDLAILKQGLAPLPDTADELRSIAATLGAADGDLLLSRDATERRVKVLSAQGRLAQYRVVAFATHGLVAGEAMGLAEPAIALTLPASVTEEDDGLLTASEAAQLKLDADWVVLSACNTAAGNTPGAEALSGLARAFFYAGARALLVSSWPVASPAAVKLTTRSFGALDKEPTIGRAEALRRAMLSLIESGTAHEAHPAYWAPFVVVGEGAAAR